MRIHFWILFLGTKRRASGVLFAFEQTLCEFEQCLKQMDTNLCVKLTIQNEINRSVGIEPMLLLR
jgi:hypothetical protein